MRLHVAWLVALPLSRAVTQPIPSASQCHPTLEGRGGRQVADSIFDPPVSAPAFAIGSGPVLLFDEAHFSFHKIAGSYGAFARLLRRDGFVVRPLRSPISDSALAGSRILVIANALAEKDAQRDWTLPISSAFQPEEVRALEQWVGQGGSLLLIADHMPFPAAAETLGRAFGVLFINGFATDQTCDADELMFRRGTTLGSHPITRGRNARERIDSVRSFTGQAFRLVRPGTPLLTLEAGAVVLMPVTAWEFSDSTPRFPAEGLLQGAALEHGRGRLAVFGEAAMFSAQRSGVPPSPMGMNAVNAAQNPQFLLNVIHWLAGLLPAH